MVKIIIPGKPHLTYQGGTLGKIKKENEYWSPIVNDDGTVSYIAEKNSTIETFSLQYGVYTNVTKAIIGDVDIVKGTIISGEKVKLITGSDVLKLRLKTRIADEQRILDQFVFATDYTRFHGKYDFLPSDFYTNRLSGSTDSVEGMGPVSGNAEIKIENTSIKVQYTIVLYNPNPNSNYAKTNEFPISNYVDENNQTGGQRFDCKLLFYRIISVGTTTKPPKVAKSDGAHFFLVGQDNAAKIYKRFKRFL